MNNFARLYPWIKKKINIVMHMQNNKTQSKTQNYKITQNVTQFYY